MIRFKDESVVDFILDKSLNQSALMVSSDQGMVAAPKRSKIGCCVCQFEKQFRVTLNKAGAGEEKGANEEEEMGTEVVKENVKDKNHCYNSAKNIVGCTKENHNLHVHSVKMKSDRFMF